MNIEEIYYSFFESKYTPTHNINIPIICIGVTISPRTRNPKIAAKNGVDSSNAPAWAALTLLRPS